MAVKRSATSIRFDKDVYEIIENWPDGKKISEKLHSLIRFSIMEVPKVEKRLARIKQDISKENQRYYAAMAKMRKFQSLRNLIEELERLGEQAAKQMYEVIEQEQQDLV